MIPSRLLRFSICVVASCVAGVGLAFLPVAPSARAQGKGAVKLPGAEISFAPPAGYKARTANAPFVFSYGGSRGSGAIPPTINLSKRPAPATIKVATPETAEAAVQVVKRAIPSYRIVLKGAMTVSGEPAAYLMSSLTVNNMPMQTKSVMVVHKKQLYTFTFGTASSDYLKQVGAFDAMVASVKWL